MTSGTQQNIFQDPIGRQATTTYYQATPCRHIRAHQLNGKKLDDDKNCIVIWSQKFIIIIIIIIERKDLGGVMSRDCKDTVQKLKTVTERECDAR